MLHTVLYFVFIFINKVSKLLIVGKSPAQPAFNYKKYQKTDTIASIIGTSHIFTISHIFTHFFCGHNVRKQREVTVH